VFVFGTNGFLVLHALLLALNLLVAYTFIVARGSAPLAALAYAVAFLAASVVPVYFVWLTPELFNVSLALWAMFLWCYKEVTPARGFLGSARSDYLAAALVGVLTFSKPPHAILMLPIGVLLVVRGQWRRALLTGVVWAAMAGGLFLANAAITGEFNYQGGDRKTFYGRDGFPFANERETFENIGPVRGRESIMVGHVLVNPHTGTVFVSNVVYFLVGRFCGLLPYFFPGVLSAVLFLARKREPWQWLTVGTIVAAALVLIVLTPFTYSGGGGPVGNRYFLSFYPLFLFLTPPLAGLGAAAAALGIGALFTAKILLNPFYSSFHPGEHAKAGPLRWPADRTDAAERSADGGGSGSHEAAARRVAAGPGVLRGRQRVQSRGRCVLGSRQVARRRDPARAGGPHRRRPVRVEGDREADGRSGKRRRSGDGHRLHGGRDANAADEIRRESPLRTGGPQRTAVYARRESHELSVSRVDPRRRRFRALSRSAGQQRQSVPRSPRPPGARIH
jgi:hypothetical protein